MFGAPQVSYARLPFREGSQGPAHSFAPRLSSRGCDSRLQDPKPIESECATQASSAVEDECHEPGAGAHRGGGSDASARTATGDSESGGPSSEFKGTRSLGPGGSALAQKAERASGVPPALMGLAAWLLPG